jgi:PAS domain S-box-containing protein
MHNPKPFILNVDDFDDGRFAKSEILRMAGFQVIEAATGKEALKQVSEAKPDLVLLDVKLPDINGFEVCRRIKKLRGFAPMVLQISMAYNLVENQTHGLESGADAYLVGPVEPDLLVANVKALLRMQKAEHEVRNAGREWQSTFDAIQDGVAIVTREGIVVRHNQAFLSFVRLPMLTNSFIGGNINLAMGEVTLAPASFPHIRSRVTLQKESAEFPVGDRWIRMIAEPIIAEDGSMEKLVVTLRDFTARKAGEIERAQLLLKEQRAKQKAEESERRFRTMAETMHQLVITVDAEGTAEYCNRRWIQQTQIDASQLARSSWTTVVHPDDRLAVEEAWSHSLKTGETFERELRIVGLDKEKRWYICRGLPELDEWGRRLSWVLTFTDIHSAKTRTRNDILLARAGELLSSSLEYQEHLPGVLNLLIPEFADFVQIDLVSQGVSIDSSIRSHDAVRLPDATVRQVISTGLSMITDVGSINTALIKTSNGAEKHLQTCVIIPLSARGHVVGCLTAGYVHGREREGDKVEALHLLGDRLASSIDNAQLYTDAQRELTERKRAERELRESEQKLRATMESMPQIVWSANAEGTLDYLNHQWYDLTGQKPEETAIEWTEYLHDEDRERVHRAWTASVRTAEVFEFEFRLRADRRRSPMDHLHLWYLARAIPVYDPSGRVQRWIGTFTNIDDKRRGEEQSRFLAEASQILLNCLDEGAVIQRVGEFIVPAYADWLSLDLVDDSGEPRRVLSIHHDPEKAEKLKRVHERFPSPKASLYGYPRVLKTGRSQLISPLTQGVIDNAAKTPEHREILLESGMRSLMCVPLLTRGRVIGCMTAAITEKRRVFDQRDLLLIEDLALRIAATLDNVQLLSDTQREVVRRREAEEKAREATAQAESARQLTEDISKGKEQLMAVVTHELRSPLTAMTSAVGLLEEIGGHSVEQPVKIIKRNIEAQAALLEDLTDFVRVRNRKLRFEPTECDVHQVIRDITLDLEPEIRNAHLDLDLSLEAANSRISGDRQRLAQVIRNIVRNAVKFSLAGGRISVATTNGAETLRVQIRDEGQGISAEFLPRIFNTFEQGQDLRSKNRSGLGLGLAISQSLIEMHGGMISVFSEGIGKGATFTIELPTLKS